MKIGLYMCGGERPESGVPLGIGYLLTNVGGAELMYCRTRAELEAGRWDLVGLSAVASGLPEAVEIARQYKHSGLHRGLIVLGGQGTLWDGLGDLGLFDWIFQGEGETILQRFVNGEGPLTAGPLDLDTLNFPERGELYGGKVPVVTSRGCPWRCAFCSSSQYWGEPRYCSPGYFIAEAEDALKKYPDARWLYIMDDLFTADRRRFDAIHDLWMRKGLNKRLGLWSFIRANTFDARQACQMVEMGYRAVRFGAESGGDRVLTVLGKHATVAQNQRAINLANLAGLRISCSYMYGIPGETEQERQATLGFIERNRDKAGVEGYYRFVAFPGTPMYDGASPLETDMRVR